LYNKNNQQPARRRKEGAKTMGIKKRKYPKNKKKKWFKKH